VLKPGRLTSLRPFAYLGGRCGNRYFTAERAEIRRGPQRRRKDARRCSVSKGFPLRLCVFASLRENVLYRTSKYLL
jgi:hypothetical protein